MREGQLPSGALAEMLRQSGELDDILAGRGLRFERPTEVVQPTRVEQGFRIEPPDWDQEARERAEREAAEQRQERERIVAEELAKLEPVEPPGRPTPPARRWRKAVA